MKNFQEAKGKMRMDGGTAEGRERKKEDKEKCGGWNTDNKTKQAGQEKTMTAKRVDASKTKKGKAKKAAEPNVGGEWEEVWCGS